MKLGLNLVLAVVLLSTPPNYAYSPTVTYATETVSIEDETTTQPSEYADLEPATADAPEDITVDFKPPSEYAHLQPATADAPEDVIVDFKPPSEYADLQPATADAPEEITVDFHKDILGCDPEKCPAYFKHLPGRCTPIFDKTCCPIAFNCSEEHKAPTKDFCKYKDKLYSSGETVKLSNPCLICNCYVDAKNESSLSCNGVDCPSVFNPPSLDKDCITVSSLNQCCSKEVCGKEARETLKKNPKCEYQGKSYKYGKDFYPKPCIKCNCNEDWTGDLKNTKSCKPVQCDIEVSSKKLDKGCEPVYLEGDCCPSYYICPEDVTSITIAQKPKVCFQERDEGTGENQTRMFFFNPKTNLCEHFFFNGTGGNDNRFQSFGQCMDKCINGYNACDLDYVTGLCLAHFTAYYFNKEKGKCEPFLYGGCGGNANNFRSMENCNAHCKQEAEPQKCVFNGVEYNKGDQLIFKPKYPKPCVSVKCIAPPHLTFIHEVAPGPPPDEDCEATYNPGECAPRYTCKPKQKRICLAPRFFQHEYDLDCHADFEVEDLNESCPIRFTCPKFPPLQESSCYVENVVYKDGEPIENSPPCKQCYCNNKSNKLVVECLGKPCENVGNLNSNNYQLCYYSFNETNSCCPVARCEQREDLKTCTYDDHIFYDGQKIFPSEDPCKVCHCNKNWTGINGPTCEKTKCNLQLNMQKLLYGCLPVYLQSACCPVNWICPDTNKLPEISDIRNKCYFNKTEYDVSADLDYPHRSNCIKCKCVAPPRFTCIQEVCPPPPQPKRGYKCVPTLEAGECCARFDCKVPIRDPCHQVECKEYEKCVRVVEDCDDKLCPDVAKCVPRQSVPCDLVSCNSTTEVCVIHRFPCDTNVNCPVRAACLPNDPCELAQLECGEGRICKNLIPGCRLSPCPKMATCVSDDPCDDDSCNPDQRCITVTESCEDEKCAKKPVCLSKDCPDVLCAPDSVYHPFGQGDDNCPWCEKKEE